MISNNKTKTWFPSISKIKYEGKSSSNPFAFKYYNPNEILMEKTMEEWLRFSVCFQHTFRGNGSDPFGSPTISREWDDGSNSIVNKESANENNNLVHYKPSSGKQELFEMILNDYL